MSLVVTQLGCVSPANTQTIFIAPLPVVNAGADASVCSGTNVTLGVSPSANTTYVWTPASGLDDPTVGQTLMHAINNDQGTTTDTYILTATTNYGCVNKDTVSVQTKAIPAAIFAHHDPACLDDNAFMFVPNGHVFPGVTYSWNFQGGTPSSSQSAVPGIVQYSAIGKYVVTLNSSYEGCPGPAYTDTIQINPMPRANFLPAVFEGCEPLTVPLANLSTLNSANFHWSLATVHWIQRPFRHTYLLMQVNIQSS
ncbi:MAG: hypothetical protein IPP51_03850 [Bacteroidetes bacterium]|nr:hypothetical protein [Bacteroidota bacterium]